MNISGKTRFTFAADARGYGTLTHYINDIVEKEWPSRSGSCNSKGELVNCIPHGIWTLRSEPVPPVESERDSMEIKNKPGRGWKCRLWTPLGEWSHYLIHPDGNKPGTKGCIGLQNTNGMELFHYLTRYFEKKDNLWIPVEVGMHYFNTSRHFITNKKKKEEKKMISLFRNKVAQFKKIIMVKKGVENGILGTVSVLLGDFIEKKLGIEKTYSIPVIMSVIKMIENLIKHK